MRRLARLKALLGFVAAIVLALAGLLLFQDYSAFKAEFATAAEHLTGRTVEIKGGIRLKLGLRPSLVMEDVSLGNAPGAKRQVMAVFRRFEAQIGLVSLLKGDLTVKRLVLVGGDVHLETDKNRRGNWNLVRSEQASADDAALLPITTFRLLDTTVTFRDGVSGQSFAGHIKRLTGKPTRKGDAVELSLRGDYNGRALRADGVVARRVVGGEAGLALPIDLQLKSGGATVDLVGSLGLPFFSAATDLRVSAAAGEVRDIAVLFDPAAPRFGAASVEARLSAGPGFVTWTGMNAKARGVRVAGSVRVDLGEGRPFVTANLSTGPLGFDTGGSDSGTERRPDGGTWVFTPTPLGYDRFPDFDGVATLSAPSVTIDGIPFRDVSLNLSLDGRVLAVRGIKARTLGGSIGGTLVVNARRRTPKTALAMTASGVDFGELLRILGVTGAVSGRGDVTLRINGRGNTLRQIASTATGGMELIVGKGQVAGKYIDLLGTDLIGSIAPWATEIDDSRVNCLVSLFRIENGTATSEGLLFDTSRVTIAGKGTIGLNDERYDLRLMPRPKDPSLLSLAVPIDLTGPLDDPSLTPNELGVAKNVAEVVVGGLINPLIVLVPLVSTGTGDQNPCLAALAENDGKNGRKRVLPEYDDRSFIHRSIEDVSEGVGQGLHDLLAK